MKTYYFPNSLLILLVALSFCSCGGPDLLTENFSSDVIGNPPVKDIPGSPTGDSVLYHPDIRARLKIVQDGTNKHLEFTDVLIPNRELSDHSSWLAFKGITTDWSKIISFSWNGKINRGNNSFFMDISDGHLNIIARLTINENGEIRVIKDSSDPNYSELVGTIRYDEYHTFTVHVDPLKNTYNLLVIGVGVQSTREDPRSPIDVTRTSLCNLIILGKEKKIMPNPELSFNWYPIKGAGRKYTITSVYIKRI